MPLTMASIGEANTIRKVGGNEETKRFLENLGLLLGQRSQLYLPSVEMLLCNIKDSRVAINQDMARHIMV